jgi:hypothetical protein
MRGVDMGRAEITKKRGGRVGNRVVADGGIGVVIYL